MLCLFLLSAEYVPFFYFVFLIRTLDIVSDQGMLYERKGLVQHINVRKVKITFS